MDFLLKYYRIKSSKYSILLNVIIQWQKSESMLNDLQARNMWLLAFFTFSQNNQDINKGLKTSITWNLILTHKPKT